MSDKLTLVSYDAMMRHLHRQEKERDRQARTRHRWKRVDNRSRHHPERRFVGWDGEGPRDAGYALFGNSDGDEICHPFIHTAEALDLLVQHKQENPDTIDVWFGGDYDVSMILVDLPRRNMAALHTYNKTIWGEYHLEHIPHKWFKVRRGEITVTLYDIHSFFDSGYYDALEAWGIGTPEERESIRLGKASRAEFLWLDIEEIRRYFRLELRLMPPLCDTLRSVFADAGYVPRSWHGPGALARMALRRHGIYKAMAESPPAVATAARYAFAGGRFELVKAGHFHGRIYNYDIHSAYPYFATFLPNLSRGTWRRTSRYEPGTFSIYRIRYEATSPDSFRLYPLFRRLPNTGVVWPYRVTGWYWEPEAALVADNPEAGIIDGWVFDEDDTGDRPFSFLAEYYDRRRRLKNSGSAAEYTFKLIINAIYGQLAQRVGWNRKDGTAPKTHQLEWAGYITSGCRASIYRAAIECGDKLISVDTDGIYASTPIENLSVGSNLGDWECTEYTDGVFWQSGVYCLKEDLGYDDSYNNWKKAKARGIPKGTYDAEDLIEMAKTRLPFKVWKNVFIGYGLADNGQWGKRNTWERKEHEYVFGGAGKRSHLGRFGRCNKYCAGDTHALGALQLHYSDGPADSEPHYLPWLSNDEEMTTVKEYGHFVLSQEDPDSEEMGWQKQLTPVRDTRMINELASAAALHTIPHKRRVFRFSQPTT